LLLVETVAPSVYAEHAVGMDVSYYVLELIGLCTIMALFWKSIADAVAVKSRITNSSSSEGGSGGESEHGVASPSKGSMVGSSAGRSVASLASPTISKGSVRVFVRPQSLGSPAAGSRMASYAMPESPAATNTDS
jgi:hypothetical protein